MIGLLKGIEKWFDLQLAYFLFNGNKQHRYQQYLNNKYMHSKTADKNDDQSKKYRIPVKFGV